MSQSHYPEALPPLRDILGNEMRLVQQHRGNRTNVAHPLPSSAAASHSNPSPLESADHAAHAYHVFQRSSQGLVQRSSSSRDDFSRVQKVEAILKSRGNFPCELCGRRFQRRAELQNHWQTHTGDRPYQCTACPRSFTTPSNLRRHMRVHHESVAVAGKSMDDPPADTPV